MIYFNRDTILNKQRELERLKRKLSEAQQLQIKLRSKINSSSDKYESDQHNDLLNKDIEDYKHSTKVDENKKLQVRMKQLQERRQFLLVDKFVEHDDKTELENLTQELINVEEVNTYMKKSWAEQEITIQALEEVVDNHNSLKSNIESLFDTHSTVIIKSTDLILQEIEGQN